MPRSLAVPALLVVAVLLAGCAPDAPADPGDPGGSAPPSDGTPTPPAEETPETPAPIPLEELFLSAEGLASLRLGQPAEDDPELGLVHLDPIACTDERTGFDLGIEEGSLLAPLWIANEPYMVSGSAAFGVNVDPAGAVIRIDLFSDAIPTDQGIRLGDPVEVVAEAYPDAAVVEGDLSDVVVVEGGAGILMIEVAREREIFGTPYWDELQVDRVFAIRAVFGDEAFAVAATDNIAGVCPF